MESSIAVFLKRWQACELPPTKIVHAFATNTMFYSRSACKDVLLAMGHTFSAFWL